VIYQIKAAVMLVVMLSLFSTEGILWQWHLN
jgi:hypothetical protein